MNVLLATHGRPTLFEETLRSLIAASKAAKVGRIVVVENGGDFGTGEICDQVDDSGLIRFLSTKGANKSAALNYGLSECDDGLVFMTDDDILLPPNILEIYRDAARGCRSGKYFGGDVKPVFESKPKDWVIAFLPQSARGSARKSETSPFLGANWAAFRCDLLSAGGFNPDFGPGSKTGATGQESEMQRRLQLLGCTSTYLPDAHVTHFVPKDRCNQMWVLKRAFRIGIERGLWISSSKHLDTDKELAMRNSRLIKTRLLATVLPTTKRRLKYQFTKEIIRGIQYGIELVRMGKTSTPPFLFEGRSNSLPSPNLYSSLRSKVPAPRA